MRIFFGLLTCALILLSGCQSFRNKPAFSPTPDESRLVDLIVRRLEISRQVAWSKYLNTLPVYDPKREAEILQHLTRRAPRYGLSAAQVRNFFTAQMKASRQYQAILLHKWNRGGRLPATSLLDLRRDIRPELDTVNAELLATLAKLQSLSKPRASQFAAYIFSTLRAQEIPLLSAHTAAASVKQ